MNYYKWNVHSTCTHTWDSFITPVGSMTSLVRASITFYALTVHLKLASFINYLYRILFSLSARQKLHFTRRILRSFLSQLQLLLWNGSALPVPSAQSSHSTSSSCSCSCSSSLSSSSSPWFMSTAANSNQLPMQIRHLTAVVHTTKQQSAMTTSDLCSYPTAGVVYFVLVGSACD